MRRIVKQDLQPDIDQFLQEKQSEMENKFLSIDDDRERKSKTFGITRAAKRKKWCRFSAF